MHTGDTESLNVCADSRMDTKQSKRKNVHKKKSHVSCVMCHVSCVMCHVFCFMCHVFCFMCHVFSVMCHVSGERVNFFAHPNSTRHCHLPKTPCSEACHMHLNNFQLLQSVWQVSRRTSLSLSVVI